jgi:hypothetical protein
MIRSGIDQNLVISPCNLQFLYQGMNPTRPARTTFCPGGWAY